MKECISCGCELNQFSESKGQKGKCRHCYNQYKKAYLEVDINLIKQSARIKANRALSKGLIIKQDCAICGTQESEMHHHDYSKPLDVNWLCHPCHSEFHALENKVLCQPQ